MVDVPDSLGDYNVNRRDTDVSFPVRLPILRHVCYSLPPLFGFAAHCTCFLCYGSSQNSLPTSGRTAWETNSTPTTPIFLTGHTGGRAYIMPTSNHPMPPQASHFVMDIAASGQPHATPHELTVGVAGDHDMESGSDN